MPHIVSIDETTGDPTGLNRWEASSAAFCDTEGCLWRSPWYIPAEGGEDQAEADRAEHIRDTT